MAEGMKMLGAALAALPEVRELMMNIDAGTSPVAVSGLASVHRAQLAAALRQQLDRPCSCSAPTKTRQTAWRSTSPRCSAKR